MKKIFILCAAAAALLAGCGQQNEEKTKPKEKSKLEEINCLKENKYTCTFEGVKHDFITDLPANCENAPLVLMLHGSGTTAEGFRNTIHFEEAANPMGYAVVYVTGAANQNDNGSSLGWNSMLIPESNNDTDFLASLAEYLQDEYSLNKNKTFVVGFSNGASMTYTLAADENSPFSAYVSVAGIMQENIWENRIENPEVNFFQITGEKDNYVPKNIDGTARHSKAPAIEDVISYLSRNTILLTEYNIGNDSVITKYENRDTRRKVWHLLVKNGSHSWSCEQLSGVNTNDLILNFFESLNLE